MLIVSFALSYLGTGPLVTLGTNLVVDAVPAERAGSAAALAPARPKPAVVTT